MAATPGMRPLPAGSNSAKAAFHSAKSALLATIHPPERRSGSHSNSSSSVSGTVGNSEDCHIRKWTSIEPTFEPERSPLKGAEHEPLRVLRVQLGRGRGGTQLLPLGFKGQEILKSNQFSVKFHLLIWYPLCQPWYNPDPKEPPSCIYLLL